jgi:hypothetical protein
VIPALGRFPVGASDSPYTGVLRGGAEERTEGRHGGAVAPDCCIPSPNTLRGAGACRAPEPLSPQSSEGCRSAAPGSGRHSDAGSRGYAAASSRRPLESEYFALLLAALYTGGETRRTTGASVEERRPRRRSDAHHAYSLSNGERMASEGTKSARSRRQIAMPRALTVHLEEHKKTLEAERATAGSQLTEEELRVLPVERQARDERSVKSRLRSGTQETRGLPHIRFHDLRHTHASLLLKAGVHPKVVSERLGHCSVSFTLDVYSHVMPGCRSRRRRKLEALIGGAP